MGSTNKSFSFLHDVKIKISPITITMTFIIVFVLIFIKNTISVSCFQQHFTYFDNKILREMPITLPDNYLNCFYVA
ncbi:MAG: hypothetical protein A2275_04580 [Bacteroidetes bacterium RIFOXYA12_FULL_35_11]|nr:MAG: hypothetical protein A2X01_13825 [Bacteroidetes bacterium GWF2_35_48]OFY75619.1 MAG: hypothetical protein A2275_04580 [Bacteroidetes bacterium RIFOXYA12_FULL_35_11]OFY94929.1 MAG: hypothetical protein A2491_12030 [Bacteroidetes bacterium RIFOXYC12_FULL_35_7]OFY95621.1 MAG: hypothetical protein A2309_00770 [Bacteroidetes bacterium RIFOXYB2_FULL_35_7]HBX52079.1 hypothetical protein [Bacteroidales bacterium]